MLSACSRLSCTQNDLATRLREAVAGLSAPVEGIVSDGQHSLRHAVAQVFPGVPHQLCHFHYLKQAAGPAWEADRHAKKELKKRVRGIHPLERAVEGRDDEEARVVPGYGAAVRGALADDGQSPLEPGGLRLHERLEAIDASLGGSAKKGGPAEATQADAGHRAPRLGGHRRAVVQSDPDLHLDRTGPAAILDNPAAQTGAIVQGPYPDILGATVCPTDGAERRGHSWAGGEHFLKIARSYWPGLFHCYDVAGLPRTDNDLEHLFGTLRPQERRITGRKVATPGLITRGPVRVLAAVISRLQPVDPV